MKKMKWKIEELLEREPSEENCPRVLYRGDGSSGRVATVRDWCRSMPRGSAVNEENRV